jgi:hypothetical protein
MAATIPEWRRSWRIMPPPENGLRKKSEEKDLGKAPGKNCEKAIRGDS